jgi:hypothetical protein
VNGHRNRQKQRAQRVGTRLFLTIEVVLDPVQEIQLFCCISCTRKEIDTNRMLEFNFYRNIEKVWGQEQVESGLARKKGFIDSDF